MIEIEQCLWLFKTFEMNWDLIFLVFFSTFFLSLEEDKAKKTKPFDEIEYCFSFVYNFRNDKSVRNKYNNQDKGTRLVNAGKYTSTSTKEVCLPISDLKF